MIRQFQNAEHVFRCIDHAFQLIPACLRLYELDEFDFVELMLTDETARIASCTARLCAETSRISTVIFRELRSVENLIAVVVRRWNLCCRNEVIVQPFQFEHILCKLRKLPRADHARLICNIRCEHLCIAVLRRMEIHHKVNAGALKTCAKPLVERKACACDLCRAVCIEDTEICADIPMRLWCKRKFFRLAPLADFRIFRVVLADGDICFRHIRNV